MRTRSIYPQPNTINQKTATGFFDCQIVFSLDVFGENKFNWESGPNNNNDRI
jgi:hypothetical protein